MRLLVLFFVLFFFNSCSSSSKHLQEASKQSIQSQSKDVMSNEAEDVQNISDLKRFAQESSPYLENIQLEPIGIDQERFESFYFSVWNKTPNDSQDTAMWPFFSYRYGDMYGENLKLIDEKVFTDIKDNANFEKYKTLNQRAVSLRHTDIRAFPTSKPMFKDPSIAGEGFPFDYMQNSSVSANKPVLISHYSKDKEWAYIFTSFTGGWVKAKDIIYIDKKYTDIWQRAQQIMLIQDGVALYDENGDFLFDSRVGMMLPLIKEDDKSYTVLALSSYKDHKPNYHQAVIPKSISHKNIMEFNKENIQKIFDEVAKSKYGWGGMYGERDCSSTVRDIYTPFGIWFPRNSFQQSKVGKVISMEELSDENKLELIKKEAKPFRTLLYKKGHILIYVGTYDNEVIAFHNTWGIKTKDENEREGRIIIGKSLYSSLKLGEDQKYYDKDAEILRNLLSMNIISN
jgi:hypothetical protein